VVNSRWSILSGVLMKLRPRFCLWLFLFIFFLPNSSTVFGITNTFFIDPQDSTLIRKMINASESELVLNASDLPDHSELHPGIHFTQQRFSYLAPSPDKTILAFSVEAGLHDWSGIYNLTTKEIKQLNLRFEAKALAPYWSGDGRFLAFEEEDSNRRRYLEIFDLEKETRCLLDGKVAKNKFLNFLQPWWSDQGDKIYFKVEVNNDYRKSLGLKPLKESSVLGEATSRCQKVVLRSVAKFMAEVPPEPSGHEAEGHISEAAAPK
jgi:hypothetical protein